MNGKIFFFRLILFKKKKYSLYFSLYNEEKGAIG